MNQRLSTSGRLTFLRVHDVGTGFGPPQDFIDVEVVIILADQEGAFGFKLRNDENSEAHQGMLNLLRDAFLNDIPVTIDFDIDPEFGRKNGFIVRVELRK